MWFQTADVAEAAPAVLARKRLFACVDTGVYEQPCGCCEHFVAYLTRMEVVSAVFFQVSVQRPLARIRRTARIA